MEYKSEAQNLCPLTLLFCFCLVFSLFVDLLAYLPFVFVFHQVMRHLNANAIKIMIIYVEYKEKRKCKKK